MYVEIATTGHRIPYLSALTENTENEVILLLPEKVESLNCKQIICEFDNINRTLENHKKWISKIYEVANDEEPDVIHFLTGDVFYRYFGFGLNKIKKYKTVLTIHNVKNGFLQKISLNLISRQATKMVFHSAFMTGQAESFGVKNACHIEYPVFGGKCCEEGEAKEYFGLKNDIPVIGCIGGTRYDKGLDILLEALKTVKEPFQLLVAGKPEYFKEEDIKEWVGSTNDNIHLALRFLTDKELMYAMNATDIVVLPYRKEFNGASGPLGEGVALGKCIVGPDHGNLKDVIETNHLGFIFGSENSEELSRVLTEALKKEFISDEKYCKYQSSLNVGTFKKSYQNLYGFC